MPSIERAIVLRDRHRYEESIAELAIVLAEDPDNAEGHAQMALSQLDVPEQKKKALASIDKALALEADNSFYVALKAYTLGQLNRDKEALEWSEQAISFDPSSFAWFVKAQVLAGQQRWAEAEEALNVTLSIDPDDGAAQNLMSMVLRMQGNLDASDDASMQRLNRDAEDPFTFANAGWTALQRGDRKKAEELFRESLRLDPSNDYARSGLLEAFKSRSYFYRLYLKWVYFLQKYEAKNQWVIIIGLYLAYRFGVRFFEETHPIVAAVILFAYLSFALGTFVAPGLGHFLILTDPLARLSLNRHEASDGLAVGLCVAAGILCLLLGFTIVPSAVAICGAYLLAASIPFSLVFRNGAPTGRILFGTVAIIAILTGLLGLAGKLADIQSLSALSSNLSPFAIIGVVLSTWLGNVPGLFRAMEPDN